jgi:hypothetical protein
VGQVLIGIPGTNPKIQTWAWPGNGFLNDEITEPGKLGRSRNDQKLRRPFPLRNYRCLWSGTLGAHAGAPLRASC